VKSFTAQIITCIFYRDDQRSLECKWEIKLPSSFLILDNIALFPLAGCSAFNISFFCRMKQLQQERASVLLLRIGKKEWIPVGLLSQGMSFLSIHLKTGEVLVKGHENTG